MRDTSIYNFNPSAPVLAAALVWNLVCAVLLGRVFGTTSHRELYAYTVVSLFIVSLSLLPMILVTFFGLLFLLILIPYWVLFAAGPVLLFWTARTRLIRLRRAAGVDF
jgi:hypothetical protein